MKKNIAITSPIGCLIATGSDPLTGRPFSRTITGPEMLWTITETAAAPAGSRPAGTYCGLAIFDGSGRAYHSQDVYSLYTARRGDGIHATLYAVRISADSDDGTPGRARLLDLARKAATAARIRAAAMDYRPEVDDDHAREIRATLAALVSAADTDLQRAAFTAARYGYSGDEIRNATAYGRRPDFEE